MNNYKNIAKEIILKELIYTKNVWEQIRIFVIASTEFVPPRKFYYGNFPYSYCERIKLIMRKSINNYANDNVAKNNLEEEKINC